MNHAGGRSVTEWNNMIFTNVTMAVLNEDGHLIALNQSFKSSTSDGTKEHTPEYS
ncbi:hypothetical protein GCM10009109_10210 [Marinobacterium sediminicola]